jgi:hypothetical protein
MIVSCYCIICEESSSRWLAIFAVLWQIRLYYWSFKEIGCESVVWIHYLRILPSDGFLWIQKLTLEFHKRSEITWPAERLLSSQDALCFMKPLRSMCPLQSAVSHSSSILLRGVKHVLLQLQAYVCACVTALERERNCSDVFEVQLRFHANFVRTKHIKWTRNRVVVSVGLSGISASGTTERFSNKFGILSTVQAVWPI